MFGRILSIALVCSFLFFGREAKGEPTGQPGERTMEPVHIGAVPRGGVACGHVGLPWRYHHTGLRDEHLPRGLIFCADDFDFQNCVVHGSARYASPERVCLRAEMWSAPVAERTSMLHYVGFSDQSAASETVHVPIVYRVERSFGLWHAATLLWFPALVWIIVFIYRRQQPHFERGAVLAWRVDEEQGYRQAASQQLNQVEINKAKGARGGWASPPHVALHEALPHGSDLPHVVCYPTSNGEIRVVAAAPIVVQPYGESLPKTDHEMDVVVPYGSVIRVGPLLCHFLYKEQQESVDAGRMVLADPGQAGHVEGRQSRVDLLSKGRSLGVQKWSFVGVLAGASVLGPLYTIFSSASSGIDVLFYSGMVMIGAATAGLVVRAIWLHLRG